LRFSPFAETGTLALEIERRFLVSGSDWRRHVRWQARLCQGYLVSGTDGLVLRVRTSFPLPERVGGEGAGAALPSAWLTLKAVPPDAGADALSRLEFEYPIPLQDGEQLLALTPFQVRKHRHGLDLPGGDWVLDLFEGANAPLVVAEVELADAAQPVDVPPWCVRELTGRHELSNAALATRPLQAWTAAERAALWPEMPVP
jgi:CYTH domain-containing protein